MDPFFYVQAILAGLLILWTAGLIHFYIDNEKRWTEFAYLRVAFAFMVFFYLPLLTIIWQIEFTVESCAILLRVDTAFYFIFRSFLLLFYIRRYVKIAGIETACDKCWILVFL
jgi:hypothetical protein